LFAFSNPPNAGDIMNSGNPTLQPAAFENLAPAASGARMTLSGTILRSATLLLLVILGTTFTWQQYQTGLGQMLMIGGAIGGLILALITIFKKTWAPVTAPIYALLQGLFIGGISAVYNAQSQGIVLQAVMLTFGTLAAMLLLYQTRIIRVNDTFRTVVFVATAGIMVLYLVSFVMSFFGASIPFLHDSSPLGIGVSVVIVIIAALNLAMDFDLIEKGTEAAAPRYMEWYCAFGLMVTLIWLYLEILRLLSKINRR
jgi:uncharacterized YccA/Bax inhibitor family protein